MTIYILIRSLIVIKIDTNAGLLPQHVQALIFDIIETHNIV